MTGSSATTSFSTTTGSSTAVGFSATTGSSTTTGASVTGSFAAILVGVARAPTAKTKTIATKNRAMLLMLMIDEESSSCVNDLPFRGHKHSLSVDEDLRVPC